MNTQTKTIAWRTEHGAALAALLVAWFGAAYYIGAGKLLVNTEGAFLAPIAVSAVVPVAVFLALYALSRRFRGVVLASDIGLLTALQDRRSNRRRTSVSAKSC